MKKLLFWLVALIIAALLVYKFCDWRKVTSLFKGETADSIAAPQYCTVEFEDSISVVECHAYQKMMIDFPAEDDTTAVAQSVLAWVCEQVRQGYVPDWSGENTDVIPADQIVETQGETFAEAFVKAYAQRGLQKMGEELKAMAEEGFEGSYYNSLQISLAEQTDDYLTFTLGREVYTGGAHGGYLVDGATFRKSDGKQMGWNLFDPSKRPELVAQLKKGIMAYFNDAADEKITTDSALYEHLILYDNPDTPENELEFGLPLPMTEPLVTKDGIAFTYQQYEIAAYACGLPSCVLPVTAVKDCLSDEGKAFFGIK